MALPTQEIERLTRASNPEQGPYKQLLLLTGSLLAISSILYLGLSYGYEPYLNKQKADLDVQIQESSKKIPQEEQIKLIGFYSQLANIKTLIGKHPFTSNVFEWLEKNSEPNTYFTKFSFNASTNQLALLGISKTADNVSDQAAIFESQPEVVRLNLSSLSVAITGGWQFNMTIFFDPKSLLPATQATPAGITPPPTTSPVSPISFPTSTGPGANSTTTR